MPWRRAVLVWILLVAVEIVHGTLRTVFLAPVIGDWRARQISVFTGSALIVLVAWLTIRWLRPANRSALLGIGALWLVLMLSFELSFGRYVAGLSWSRIWSDYDVPRGGLLPFGLLMLTLSPWIGASLRRQ